MRPAQMLEWVGLTVIKRYLSSEGQGKVTDVHSDPDFFEKGIDLILHEPNGSTTNIDVKVDSYYGSDPNRKVRGLCNPDSGFILLEVISQLQFHRHRNVDDSGTIPVQNRPDVPGWFFTSQADQVYYYFIAILNSSGELRPLHNEWVELTRTQKTTGRVEDRLLKLLNVDRDLLVTYQLGKARSWFETAQETAFGGYAGAVNPTYVTVSRRAKRDQFITQVPAQNLGSLFRR